MIGTRAKTATGRLFTGNAFDAAFRTIFPSSVSPVSLVWLDSSIVLDNREIQDAVTHMESILDKEYGGRTA